MVLLGRRHIAVCKIRRGVKSAGRVLCSFVSSSCDNWTFCCSPIPQRGLIFSSAQRTCVLEYRLWRLRISSIATTIHWSTASWMTRRDRRPIPRVDIARLCYGTSVLNRVRFGYIQDIVIGKRRQAFAARDIIT